MPPNSAFEEIDVYDIENDDSTIDYAIDFNFWFDNERSDLTLQAMIFHNENFEITDIRVL